MKRFQVLEYTNNKNEIRYLIFDAHREMIATTPPFGKLVKSIRYVFKDVAEKEAERLERFYLGG